MLFHFFKKKISFPDLFSEFFREGKRVRPPILNASRGLPCRGKAY